MKKNLRVALLIFICVLVCSAAAFAAGSGYTKQLTANYAGITLVVHGETVTPKDASGNIVDPFIVDGTTYLPVRAVAEALGEEVSWDGATKTVYIGMNSEQEQEQEPEPTPEPTPCVHEYEESIVPATCTENGIKKQVCKNCGDAIEEQIPALGHEYEESVVSATCTTDGVKKQICKNCGDTIEERIPALGHDYDAGVVETPATYSSTGIKVYTCSRCGDTKKETIPQKDISSSKYPESTYLVGTDMPEGEYILISDSMTGYFCISSNPNGRSILANDAFGYITYVNAVKGTYLKLSRCYAIPYTEEITFNPVDNGYVQGTYKVGKDFAAGTYKLTTIENGYYEITKSPQGKIQSNDNFTGSTYISVSDGEYVYLSRVLVEKVS